jgi:Uma2 family endonuclease
LALVSIQNPVRVDEHDLPQPDAALLRPRRDFYGQAKARPEDVLLLVEVSDSTLRIDLGRKTRIYADAGVGGYWVVDLKNQVVYLHPHPVAAADRYTNRQVLGLRTASALRLRSTSSSESPN